MKYREPKEVRIYGRQRYVLTPVPGTPGFWLLCHPSVCVTCPACGAKPNTPCIAKRGHVPLTTHQATIAFKLASGTHVPPSERQILRNALIDRNTYREKVHRQREAAWKERGLAMPPGKRGPSTFELAVRTEGRADNLEKRLQYLNSQLAKALEEAADIKKAAIETKEAL